jgi:hypothetical protein
MIATSMNANSSNRSGPSRSSTSSEKRHMPCAETPVAMEAATIVSTSSTGRGATYLVKIQDTARQATLSTRTASARPTRLNSVMTAVASGFSVMKAAISSNVGISHYP